MITALFAKIGPWFVGIGGALLGVLAIFASAKKSGQAEGRATAAETIAKDREAIAASEIKKQHEAAKTELESVEKANNATAEVNRTSSDAVLNELRDKWTRD